LRIREFCRYIDRFRELRENTDFFPASDEVTAGGIITVTSDGSVFTYSPELATNRHGHRSYRLGNLDDVADFDEFFAGAAFKAIRAEVEAGVAACKRECHYFNLCGGGSPSNKVSEHGRADVTQTLSCRFHVQEMVEALLENLSKRSMEPTPGNAAESRS
jgi:uncharacterized protein